MNKGYAPVTAGWKVTAALRNIKQNVFLSLSLNGKHGKGPFKFETLLIDLLFESTNVSGLGHKPGLQGPSVKLHGMACR